MQRAFALLLASGLVLVAGAASAQGFDCTKARSPVEEAICATPSLIEQDRALSAAYAARLAADQAGAAALRTEQRGWLAGRSRTCASKNEPLPRVAACLAGLYRSRLAALAPATQAVAPAGPAPAGPAPPRPPGLAQRAAPVPPAAAVLPEPVPPSVAPLPARVPEGEAALSAGAVPAGGRTDVTVEVRAGGRFSIRAESRTGVALQLVDAISGPSDVQGAPGMKDGRVDALLDRGTYRLRVLGAANAPGEAKLSIAAFRQEADASPSLVFGGAASSSLTDLGQRSWWVQVEKGGRVSVEAAGRSLADLRLWRNGRDLAALAPSAARVTPRSGHPLTRMRLDGVVEPGLYLATAYGGPKLAWTDGDGAEPLHVRVGEPEPVAGWLEGTIGPTGSARFAAPGVATQFRLELPEPAPATLKASRGSDVRTATIVKNSREPFGSVELGGDAASGVTLEVSGQEGQSFRLAALDPSASRRIAGAGPHWLAVDVAGGGGDEVPATVLLAQFEAGKGGRVLAANAPTVGPGRAWRGRLNLRGTSSLVFEVAAATPLAVTATGLKVSASIGPLLGARPPRADGKTPRWDLEPGWYVLRLEPQGGASGILDLTVGPPGVAGEAPRSQAAPPSIALGIHSLERGGNYQILTNEAPGLVLAPLARALPADLQSSPFAFQQAAGQALDIPVRMPRDGALAVRAANGVPVPVALADEKLLPNGRTATVRLPAPERARRVVVSWLDPGRLSPVSAPPAEAEAEFVVAGATRFFDLPRDGVRSFAIDVAEGGLYRVETLGRLKTSLTVATPFSPSLDTASANGAGANALAQTYLRAGRYTVLVKASESSGRVGLTARPALLPPGAPLLPDGAARARLEDGRGVAFPVEIAQAGRYRLDLYGLGRTFRARLEDEAGWPLTAPGPLESIEHAFEPGRYRLAVLPPEVEARVVARLTRLVPDPAIAGHGPHPLAFDRDTSFQWREPPGAGEERVPDRWTFALAGPADVTLALTDGMAGELVREDGAGPVARIVGRTGFSGRLPPGRYRLDARAQGRNDRLDYRVSLAAKEIQPGAPRRVDLPATIPFAIGADRVVSLTSFGRTDLRGTLRDGDGRVVERLDGRADDWNVGLSRRLPAGAYTIELAAVGPGPARKTEAPPDEETAAAEPGAAPDETVEGEPDASAPEQASAEEGGADEAPQPPDTRPEIRLALPDGTERPALESTGEASVAGAGVSVFGLPPTELGSLLVVAAKAEAETVLSLERRDAGGRWQTIGLDRGLAPIVAVPGDADRARPWRASVWSVDGGPGRIAVAARSVHREPGGTGLVEMAPVELGSVGSDLRVDLTAAPASGLLVVKERPKLLLAGSVPGGALEPADALLVPQSDAVWLLARGAPAPLVVEPAPLPLAGEVGVSVPAEGRATWPKAAPAAGQVRVWRATSTFGQPALSSGRGFGIADRSALALGGPEALRVWNAGGAEALPVRVAAFDLALGEEVRVEGTYAGVLPGGGAMPVRLPGGGKRLGLDLPAGTAAVAGWTGERPTTVWAGGEASSRSLAGDWTSVLLVNLADAPRPVRLAVAPLGAEPVRLDRTAILKRFFGAAGSLSLPVAAEPGDRLVATGADATFVGRDGRVARGATLALSGPGDLTLTHGAGLVAAWIEGGDRSPWPQPPPRPAALPSVAKLDGPAMAFALRPEMPVLLHARTSAPVILALRASGGEGAAPAAFAAGAEFGRLLAPGESVLTLHSPHDGPLAGSLELTASPVLPAREGIGDAVTLAPGGAALFGFAVKRPGEVGIGVRAEPDVASARLLDEAGRVLGTGIAQLQTLAPGRYVLEASVPADGRTSLVRPALVGIDPPPSGPPPDVVADYLRLVGLAPTAPSR